MPSETDIPFLVSLRGRLVFPAAALLLLITAAFALRAALLPVRFFDPDELEHLQASFLISHGWTPHKDFFEHHNHLLHYLLLPLLPAAPGPETIFAARLFMLILTGGILLATGALARALDPPLGGFLAAAWLSLDFVFLSKTLEVRPDVPAMLFLCLGMLCLLRKGGRTGIRWALAGLTFSLAFLATQKAAFPILGIALVMLLLPASDRKWTRWTKWTNYGAFAAAFLFPLLIALLYYHQQGVLLPLLKDNFLLNFAWKRRFSPLLFFAPVCLFDPFFVFWTGAGMCLALRDRRRDLRGLLPFGALGGGIAGALVSPVVYAHYYAMLMPFAAILAASALLRFLEWLPAQSGRIRFPAGLLFFLPAIPQAYLVFSSIYRYPIPLENAPLWVIISLAAGGAAWLIVSFPPRRFSAILVPACLLAAVAPRSFNLMLNYRSFTNAVFLRSLRTVHALAGPNDINRRLNRIGEDTNQNESAWSAILFNPIRSSVEFSRPVLDGWTGLGVFRYPAYYYGFLHPEVLLMLSPEEKGEKLLQALRENRPAVVLRDNAWYSFSPEVRRYIGENYVTEREEWLGGERIQIMKRRKSEGKSKKWEVGSKK